MSQTIILPSEEAIRQFGASAICAGFNNGTVTSWGVDERGRLLLKIDADLESRLGLFSTFRRKIFGVPEL